MIETIQHDGLKWLHISNPTEEDYRYLLETYNFHALDIEDCRGTNQRPKIDEYDDYYFMILHFYSMTSTVIFHLLTVSEPLGDRVPTRWIYEG